MSTTSPSIPSGILQALQMASGGTAVDGRTFEEVMLDLTLPHESDDGVLMNKYDLLCPRGCRSTILKRGVGKWVERSGVEMNSPGHTLDPSLTPLPAPPTTVQWWLVTPSAMVFENIGFSRPVILKGDSSGIENILSPDCTIDLSTGESRSVKFLICADCDVGPLGWCEGSANGTEFWLACSRVKYAAPR